MIELVYDEKEHCDSKGCLHGTDISYRIGMKISIRYNTGINSVVPK